MNSFPGRIAILTGISLAGNPRVTKEAITLASAGFDVVVYGSSLDASQLEADQAIATQRGFTFCPVIPIDPTGRLARYRLFTARLRNRIGRHAYQAFAIQSSWQLGWFPAELLRHAQAANANYHVAHLEQAAWVAQKLLRAGARVGVDMEDWFSEDLLPEARRQRPLTLLRRLERHLLRHGAHATCPSRAMSDALAQAYGCGKPTVIYNAFQWSDRGRIDGQLKDRRNRHVPSVHWFSQTLGHGRGLEDLLNALPHLQREVEIHIRGNPVAGFDDWLSSRTPDGWHDRIFVHGVVPSDELLSRISEHDIGFAGEMKYCRNKDLTISNKILQYLLAGLAVVASDTEGQQEVAAQAPGAVLLYPSGDPVLLAAQLNTLLSAPEQLKHAKAAALRAAEQTFCWERQEKALVTSIARAVGVTVN